MTEPNWDSIIQWVKDCSCFPPQVPLVLEHIWRDTCHDAEPEVEEYVRAHVDLAGNVASEQNVKMLVQIDTVLWARFVANLLDHLEASCPKSVRYILDAVGWHEIRQLNEEIAMFELVRPDFPKGNMYEMLKEKPDDPDAKRIIEAADAAMKKQKKLHRDFYAVMGNAIIRYGCIKLMSGTIPVKEDDQAMINLQTMGDEFLANLGENPPLLKFVKPLEGT